MNRRNPLGNCIAQLFLARCFGATVRPLPAAPQCHDYINNIRYLIDAL
jgi:hypothetical protein